MAALSASPSAVSPLLAKIADMVDDAHRDAWKDVRKLCDGALARSGGGGKKSKSKNNKKSGSGDGEDRDAKASSDDVIAPAEILLCRAYQARANREMGKFEDALHACQAILKAAPRDAPTTDPRVLEQIRHVFQAYRMDTEILNMYVQAYSHPLSAVAVTPAGTLAVMAVA